MKTDWRTRDIADEVSKEHIYFYFSLLSSQSLDASLLGSINPTSQAELCSKMLKFLRSSCSLFSRCVSLITFHYSKRKEPLISIRWETYLHEDSHWYSVSAHLNCPPRAHHISAQQYPSFLGSSVHEKMDTENQSRADLALPNPQESPR